MNTQLILNYLSELSINNNREWYHEHKAENKAANTEFETLVGALILRIGEFDSSVLHNEPKNLTFKLMRDTRFSHDKLPFYKARRPVLFRRRPVCRYVQRCNGNGTQLYCRERQGI